MQYLRIWRGPPASGKSTEAREFVAKDPKNWIRINRDDLRVMMNMGVYSQANENIITKMTHSITYDALKKGLNVVTDDTNLRQKTVNEWHAIAKKVGDVTVIETYVDTPLKVCLERDAKRDAKVGEDVIMKFWDKYIKGGKLKLVPTTYYPPNENNSFYIQQDESLPKCILCDIDGTIAKMNGKRGPFEWHNVGRDDVNKPVHDLLNTIEFANYYLDEYGDTEDHIKIIFFSGRDGICRDETIKWFKDKTDFEVKYGDNLFMRTPNDMRKDSIVKDELYEEHIKGKYNVQFVLDDRDQVVKHWREVIGLPCFQVEYGAF